MPVEGAHLFMDSIAIPKARQHVKNARAFINYILRPEISAKISEAFPYHEPERRSARTAHPRATGNPASYPTAETRSMQTFQDIGEQATKVDELMTSLKAQ